jgi:hypothetical protein
LCELCCCCGWRCWLQTLLLGMLGNLAEANGGISSSMLRVSQNG